MGYAIFVFGPAGSGKSTFCRSMKEHGATIGRNYKVVNLDPAQVSTDDEYEIDIREFVTVEEMMESYDCGPNGGLLAVLKEFYESIDEMSFGDLEDSFLVFDCPGQLELFMHSDVMLKIIEHVKQYFRCGVVYVMESQYFVDIHKYISGCFCALVSMARLSVTCMNVISKMDLIAEDESEIFYTPTSEMSRMLGNSKYSQISRKILEFVVENSMIDFIPLDWGKEESVEQMMYQMDSAVQYYDDAEPRARDIDE
ncbi:putative ATP binding protein [Ordospora colligata]|uniref:GPN-loop GTPase 3 n=1 Tax=Ordospora colligata OC4 TaxID=1354746 RepID=A0A0B2UE23_9MICR|nr:putative ATP binding protein [Ordospora colligata OC4]KHN69316.1 putative ATP binding protein [Ordospora colligata OC4]TBU14830.1 putative ATP binding protein [Ordospora colligata]TBU14961.1 putative ATP binding protein [Ordospora colligata]TBU18345.1 putative ATP binding protein [Ordospora colligata]